MEPNLAGIVLRKRRFRFIQSWTSMEKGY